MSLVEIKSIPVNLNPISVGAYNMELCVLRNITRYALDGKSENNAFSILKYIFDNPTMENIICFVCGLVEFASTVVTKDNVSSLNKANAVADLTKVITMWCSSQYITAILLHPLEMHTKNMEIVPSPIKIISMDSCITINNLLTAAIKGGYIMYIISGIIAGSKSSNTINTIPKIIDVSIVEENIKTGSHCLPFFCGKRSAPKHIA